MTKGATRVLTLLLVGGFLGCNTFDPPPNRNGDISSPGFDDDLPTPRPTSSPPIVSTLGVTPVPTATSGGSSSSGGSLGTTSPNTMGGSVTATPPVDAGTADANEAFTTTSSDTEPTGVGSSTGANDASNEGSSDAASSSISGSDADVDLDAASPATDPGDAALDAAGDGAAGDASD